jgi:hypothetical protein
VTKDAEAAQKARADELARVAQTATVRLPIPDGLVPRRTAVGIGVGLSVLALLLSYLSVRVASNRRFSTLFPLREAATSSRPGLHAAAVLRLAAQPNGGFSGSVMGGAIGGLTAAAIQPADTDWFLGGVMAGFLIGLAIELISRLVEGASRWRERTTELAEIEKPTIPMILVLSGVKPGLEAAFLTFFSGLSDMDAANTVEKLATQSEERILAIADASVPVGPVGAAQGTAPATLPSAGLPATAAPSFDQPGTGQAKFGRY